MTGTRSTRRTGMSLVTGLVLSLSACGGTDSGPGGSASEDAPDKADEEVVYEFEEARVADKDDAESFQAPGPVVARLSDDLEEAVPDGKSLAIESFTITGESFSTGLCKAEIDIAYRDGGRDYVTAPFGQEAVEDDPDLKDEGARVQKRLIGGTGDIEVVDSLPPDERLEDGETYVTSDYEKMAKVTDCSDDEADELVTIPLTYISDSSVRDFPDFAEIEIAVLDDATVVINGDVEDAEVGTTGDWKPKPE